MAVVRGTLSPKNKTSCYFSLLLSCHVGISYWWHEALKPNNTIQSHDEGR